MVPMFLFFVIFFLRRRNGFSKCFFCVSALGLGPPFGSSHNTARMPFRTLVVAESCLGFAAERLSSNEFCLHLGTYFPPCVRACVCVSGLQMTETTRGVYALNEDFFFPSFNPPGSLCIANLLLKQINDSDSDKKNKKMKINFIPSH